MISDISYAASSGEGVIQDVWPTTSETFYRLLGTYGEGICVITVWLPL